MAGSPTRSYLLGAMPHLVLTNDDGIDAPGLEVLASVCRELGHEVSIIAPLSEQSGVGHSVTETELRIETRGERVWGIEGSPVDCARVALRHLVKNADGLVSGINRGANLGTDAYISGTIAAAREACMLGTPAIAISQYVGRFRKLDWDGCRGRALTALEDVLARPAEARHYWNINLPHPEDESAPCVLRECLLDPSPKDVKFEARAGAVAWQGDYHDRPRLPDYDTAVCMGGEVSLTRMGLTG